MILEIVEKLLIVKDVSNSTTSKQSDYLKAGFSSLEGRDWNKIQNFIEISNLL